MSDDLHNEAPDAFSSKEKPAPKKRVTRKKADAPVPDTPAETPVRKPASRSKKAVPAADEAVPAAKPRKTKAAKAAKDAPSEIADAPPVEKKPRASRTSKKEDAPAAPVAEISDLPAIKVVRETVEIIDAPEREHGEGNGRRHRNANGNGNGNGSYEGNGRNRHQQRQGKFGKNGFQNNRNGKKNFRDARNKNGHNGNNAGKPPQQPLDMGPPEEMEGLLEITPKGFGFLRTPDTDFAQLNAAIYVSNEMIRAHGLRHAVWIEGMARRHERGGQLTEVLKVNGLSPEEARKLPSFDELKAVNPSKRIAFETTPDRYTTRTLDLMAPVGRGQRGLIVSPPRAGKTTFLQHMAEAVQTNHADSLHLMVLLIDERPEEVTEFKRSLPGAEIYASSNDGKVRDHCRLAELCIERARRLVEAGRHVFLLMDSITRLARAYNNADKGSGRTMSGGIDARALEMPRRLFASARNTRQAGSLTILATALVETNSRMDDLIFQEFKGTGNMELVLNRRIAEQYIYPAVDILKSGTRREELILPENWLYKIHLIRRALAGHKPVEAMERLLFFLRKYPNNTQMLLDLKQRV